MYLKFTTLSLKQNSPLLNNRKTPSTSSKTPVENLSDRLRVDYTVDNFGITEDHESDSEVACCILPKHAHVAGQPVIRGESEETGESSQVCCSFYCIRFSWLFIQFTQMFFNFSNLSFCFRLHTRTTFIIFNKHRQDIKVQYNELLFWLLWKVPENLHVYWIHL